MLGSTMFVVGILMGTVVTYIVQAIKFQEFFVLEQQMNVCKDIEKCNQAYFAKSPDIAIWELENFLADTESTPQAAEYEKIHHLDLFVAQARLAKLNKNLGELEKAEQHFNLAMTNYNLANGPKEIPITNEVGVLDNLKKFDAKLFRAYP